MVEPAAPLVEASPVDQKAHAAATSPTNGLAEPSEAQKEAGNYAKGHARIGGLDISIENPAGSTRSGTDQSGKPWSVTMRSHYGYVRGSVGKDKDHVDVFVKPGTPEDYAGPVYVVDQRDPRTKRFDEHKAMIGFASRDAAEAGYRENYAADWKGAGQVTEMPWERFRAWVKDPEQTKRPAGKAAVPSGQEQEPVTPGQGESPANHLQPMRETPHAEQEPETAPETEIGRPAPEVQRAPVGQKPKPKAGVAHVPATFLMKHEVETELHDPETGEFYRGRAPAAAALKALREDLKATETLRRAVAKCLEKHRAAG